MEDNKFPDPNAPISSKEAHNILIKAFNGDPVAVYAIFSRINMHVEPSKHIPEEFLLYFLLKSIQLRQQKNINALTSALPKNAGRKKTHFEQAKMVAYLRKERKMTLKQATEQVALNLHTDPDVIHNACVQWPSSQRKYKTLSPLKEAMSLRWDKRINSQYHYQIALEKLLNGEDTPYTYADLLKAALTQPIDTDK